MKCSDKLDIKTVLLQFIETFTVSFEQAFPILRGCDSPANRSNVIDCVSTVVTTWFLWQTN